MIPYTTDEAPAPPGHARCETYMVRWLSPQRSLGLPPDDPLPEQRHHQPFGIISPSAR